MTFDDLKAQMKDLGRLGAVMSLFVDVVKDYIDERLAAARCPHCDSAMFQDPLRASRRRARRKVNVRDR